MSTQRRLPGGLAIALLLSLLLSLCLTSCVLHATSPEITYLYVYRLSTPQDTQKLQPNAAIAAESIGLRQDELEAQDTLDDLMTYFNEPPTTAGFERAFPSGVDVLSWSLTRGRAEVVMSPAYRTLTGIERTLGNYCLVMTLYRLSEVLSVDIVCQNTVIYEGLTGQDVLLSDAGYAGCACIVKLFLPDESGQLLRPVSVVTQREGGESYETLCLQALLEQCDAVPDNTQLLSVTVEDGLCVVNVSEEIYTTEPDSRQAAKMLIASFVETLTHLRNVESVRLEVSGSPMRSYGSYTTIWPARHDQSLIAP